MSLCIDIDKVDAVLLADGWHAVDKKSFGLDAYEYVQKYEEEKPSGRGTYTKNDLLFNGGQAASLSSTGFAFIEVLDSGSRVKVSGPITAILAVQEQVKA